MSIIAPRPMLSVVIPTLDEAASLGALLDDLATLPMTVQVIVADGGSMDDTGDIARARGAAVLLSPRGRGTQLRAGAAAAVAPTLLFLHADVRVPPPARASLTQFVHDGGSAGCFRLAIAAPGLRYRAVELAANLRTRWLGLPYGDQGLAIARGRYDATGGYAEVPLMEDVVMSRALARSGGITILEGEVEVSARRWERDGVLRRSLANLTLLLRFLAGASPERLARRYR